MSNVSQGLQQQLQAQIATLRFMDDTNWISSSLENLEDILEGTDKFYTITQAAINKDKSKLLINTTAKKDLIPIKFGTNIVPIQPSFDAVRFLEVMINIYLNHSYVKKDLKMNIRRFVNLTKMKPITDQQFSYIANHVL